MKIIYTIILLLSTIYTCNSQNQNHFSIEVNYGMQGNFFVKSYHEEDGPSNKTAFFNKNFLGSIGGLELKYNFKHNSSIGFAYSKSVNSKVINYQGPFNSIQVSILDFRIRHVNQFFQLYYEHPFSKKIPGFTIHGGIYYLRVAQQEVELANYANTIYWEERTSKNSNLSEGGIFIGLQYAKKIDTKFDLGIKSRIYYTLSAAYLECITLTPSLTYHFVGKKK